MLTKNLGRATTRAGGKQRVQRALRSQGAASCNPQLDDVAAQRLHKLVAGVGPAKSGEVPDDVLDRLTELARVPDDLNLRLDFKMYVRWGVKEAWLPERLAKKQSSPVVSFIAPEARSLLARLGRAALEFKDALQNCVTSAEMHSLLSGTLYYINDAIADVTGDRYLRLFLREHLDQFTPLIELGQIAGNAARYEHPNGYVRPKKHEVMRKLVRWLFLAERAAGGHFTFTDADGGEGTLINALDMLRPFLPEKALPEDLPIPTLKRVVGECRHLRSKARTESLHPS